MNSSNPLVPLDELSIDAIALAPRDVDRARQLSRSMPPAQQWQTYQTALALAGFEQWVQSHAPDVTCDTAHCSIFQAADIAGIAAACQVRVNDFQICIIATASQPDEVAIPTAAIVLPELIAHFYVAVEIYEEQAQAVMHSFFRYDQLIAQLPQYPLADDGTYALPLRDWDPDLDRLLLYLRCSEPAALPLPAIPPDRPLSALLQAIAQPAIKVQHWLNNQLDDVAQQLAWVLLPANLIPTFRLTAAVSSPRSSETTFAPIIEQLLQRGLVLPPNPRVAYQDLLIGSSAAQVAAIVGVRPTAPNQPLEWSLLIIVGPQPKTHLPIGIQLQVSTPTELLVQQTLLNSADDYLFAQVIGLEDEVFWITVTLPSGQSLSLPPFAFR